MFKVLQKICARESELKLDLRCLKLIPKDIFQPTAFLYQVY